MKSSIQFNSLAERIAYKKKQHREKKWMREMVEESDRSIASLVLAMLLGLGIVGLVAFILVMVRGVL